ncbi:hypothetical protein V9T40_001564 [Parthenolecanium corni]|uniref:RRM domain-containing protein n=1 Tax=Parthenolecanium corni TaxID=536013 RepID=A0AAN9TKF8_9HEMI
MDVDGEKGDVEMASESDSDDMSSADEAKENELNQQKSSLLNRIKNDKTDYYAYVELIKVLSELGQLDELRKIREAFSEEYPLSPELWLSWIEDEKKIAATPKEKEHVKNLFERALQDYLSIDVWLEYVQFSIGLIGDGNQMENVRSILERAVSLCGLNAAKGSLLWELYREFEKIVLVSVMESCTSEEETKTKKRQQKQRIAETFRRQLSIPLMEMENTYQELGSWLNEEENSSDVIDMASLEASYKKALEKLSRILSFEESLLCCEPESNLPIYQKYLSFEKNPYEGGNDPFRVRCLYERALVDNPLNESLWDDYIKYLSDVVKIPEDTMHACRRAIRNCPREEEFWCHLMILMEKSNRPRQEITEMLNKALPALMSSESGPRSVWLSYIYYLRRQLSTIPKEESEKRTKGIDEIREVVNMAFQHLNKYYGSGGDPECLLLLWWARFEAETCHDLERFRLIWTDIMNSGFSESSTYWLRYIQMEWQYGDAKHMRKLCSRALSSTTDSPEEIAALWLEYESQLGSLDSFLNCQKLCNEKLKEYSEKKKSRKLDDKKKKLPAKPEKKKPVEDALSKTRERKADDTNVNGATSKSEESKKESPEKSKTTGTFVPHDPSKDHRTIFISNLSFDVEEDKVREVLGSAGKIEEVRFVRNFRGQFKGFGYVVFSTDAEAKAALKLDRTRINERAMFISECNPNKLSRKTGLRFSTNMEKNKLFIKGLPLSADKVALEKLFSPYGILQDIRIVTYRNGHSKGMAYIEFEDETSAAHALLKTDGLEIEGKTISVAISNPPERKNNPSLTASEVSISAIALGGGKGGDKSDFGSRGRGRTQLSFLPRVVATAQSSDANRPEKMDVTDSTSNPSTKKPLSNADFRSMLLNTK